MATEAQRKRYLEWLLELTAIPTAAGCEHRVVRWIQNWVTGRRNLRLRRDAAGNLLITQTDRSSARPIYITAHLDHPAFVVTGARNRTTIEMEFRGGVNDPYFKGATIEIFDATDRAHPATITKLDATAKPFKLVTARLKKPTDAIVRGDIGRWRFPKPQVRNGILHTNACDDLAAAAAALATMDILRRRKGCENIGILFTLAEEVGFIGAIAACKLRSVPKRSRLICLENSRSFPESPIGAGPILRVGDRLSVFSPTLTNRLSDILFDHDKKTASRKPSFKWQRKLMPGGACEATAFSTYGYESTCVCLPLGNYHNMQDIDGVANGKRPAKVGREYISVEDYHDLIDLLVLTCSTLDSATVPPIADRLDGLLKSRRHVLGLRSKL